MKPSNAAAHPVEPESLPSRERGLKLCSSVKICPDGKSLPSRERGLKHAELLSRDTEYKVAPFAGAWIETDYSRYILHPRRKSLPSRERGLKPLWAELTARPRKSLPSRERGLKLFTKSCQEICPSSLPSRERGLKLFMKPPLYRVYNVAPFAGAWIETTSTTLSVSSNHRRSLRGSVD